MDEVNADRTGLHSVIIQGIHFIDLETGAAEVKQSKWGPCIFGDLSLPHILNCLTKDVAEQGASSDAIPS
ncbi:hypothetical protein NT6N_24850 [Oceaniferula spumae]|uniref:Uncharacterized protein n=1 Tax=Oceaniferula spumae TaxID=2979115 RepID=A0AAT9FNB9_9BACT